MRSSATAGLTPQQLLDRRRAQNKLAQRRFREKARMARAAGSASSASYLAAAAASAMPTFPPHLDLTASSMVPRLGHGRIRSASSDSSCSSSSVSLSSQVSSPSSSCTELNTPTMPTFTAAYQPPPVTFMSSNNGSIPHAGPVFVAEVDPKSDLGLIKGAFCIPPPPLASTNSFVAQGYAPFEQQIFPQPPPPPPHISLSEQPSVTYSSLASSSSSSIHRNVGLKMVGMHSDPFLMSQPLPSPSLLLGSSSSNPSMLSGAMFFAPPHESQSMPSTSFENLLCIPSCPSTCSNTSSDATHSEEPCLSPPSSSSTSTTHTTPTLLTDALQATITHNETQVSQSASFHLGKAISKHATRPSRLGSVAITSQPFSRVIEQIGARFGFDLKDGEDLSPLLSRLHLDGKRIEDTQPCKGLVFDAAIDWDVMGSNMLPTTEQLLYPHRAFIDACLPWPAVRSRLLKHALTNPLCEEELALDLLLSILSPDEALASFTVYGDDILDPDAWELSQHMLNKWWGLFDDSSIRRSNWWRRQRGLKDLVIPTFSGEDESANNESQRNGFGTGSLDQVHHLASTLFQ